VLVVMDVQRRREARGHASRSALRQCPRLSGPTVHQAGQTLSHYVIGAHGRVTCAFARTWVARILRESTPTSSLAKPKGPPGWQCLTNAKSHVAFNGSCRSVASGNRCRHPR
jgi:hypothetical protein